MKLKPWMLLILVCVSTAVISTWVLRTWFSPSAEFTHQSAPLRPVPSELVCMVNDTYFGQPQIPVMGDNKTYYGCCDMCEELLTKDDQYHFARDPMTGEMVDKATAYIAADSNNKAYYFVSKTSYDVFVEALKRGIPPVE
ncbi:hypothetical protein VST7929_01016 [Vibrio stylophorae]|uniref:TRASH transcription regulator C-terminal archaeal domain-containing protein n=1 Tax=Vibrio stylophorae TaxID=659351 RepID=A0ABM8ZS72_9VIBR|nr:hypothetical protein [Vibrio stylophorae]CAH0533155.1 hypothetical protein VST7929_01016 [Vibrio stylophorae]